MGIKAFEKLMNKFSEFGGASVPVEEPALSSEEQRKVAESVLAEYKHIDVRRAVISPSLVTKHFEKVLKILDDHNAIDLKNVPNKGKGNRVDVPKEWGPSLIGVVNGVFSADKWGGHRVEMKKIWEKSVPAEFKKLTFAEPENIEVGEAARVFSASLFRNNLGRVPGVTANKSPENKVFTQAVAHDASINVELEPLKPQYIAHRKKSIVVEGPSTMQ